MKDSASAYTYTRMHLEEMGKRQPELRLLFA